MRKKLLKILIYTFATIVGFFLYVQFRIYIAPNIADFKGDIKAEINAMKKQLPMKDESSGVTIKSLTYDDNLNLFFDVEFDKKLYQGLSKEEGQLRFNNARLSSSLCSNELVRYIINNKGTVKARLTVSEMSFNKIDTLICLSNDDIQKILNDDKNKDKK
jgi:hypothetical protein